MTEYKKNFETVEAGRTYIQRNRQIYTLEQGGIDYGTWDTFGKHRIENIYDLICEIEPPVIVPVKQKIKREFKGYVYKCDIDSGLRISIYQDVKNIAVKYYPATLTWEEEE